MNREQEIRNKISKKYKRRFVFLGHFIATFIFAISMSEAFFIPYLTANLPGFVLLMAILLFFSHALWLGYQEIVDWMVSRELKKAVNVDDIEAIVTRAVQRELGYYEDGSLEKFKHDAITHRLSDDGELVDYPVEDYAQEQWQQYHD